MIFSYLATNKWVWIGLGIFLFAGLAYWYYNDSQSRIARLQKEMVKQELVIDQQKKTIEAIKRDLELIRKIRADTQKKLDETRKKVDELERVFNKNGRNFGRISKEKPKLIQKRINRSVEKNRLCLEAMSRGDYENVNCRN